ncbi:hypothetical protein J5N97_010084 [Dioscorea zingiberensis]|uniref:Uncharacterized protein n=1 Tax=Dioscorea zingiberensis TaxID=325984 RepID=A0A9D5HM84_9LILI|nr:hypothetical protein J5N97_010084 [Dioscorea zingiberensis]
MLNTTSGFLIAALLAAAMFPSGFARELSEKLEHSKQPTAPNSWDWPGSGHIPDPDWFFNPGNNWGNSGGGYGGGYGGPNGGYNKGGVVPPSVVCSEQGPCYKKRLTCPAKCFTYYSRSGRNYGGGGGGGGCTMDCEKNCVAYC